MSDEPLEQANRVIISVAALVVAFAALLIVLLAWGAADGAIGRIEDFAGYLSDHKSTEAKTILTLGAIVVVLLMLTILIVELTPSPTQSMRVRNVRAGDAIITTKEIAAAVEGAVSEVEHVAACSAIVAARGNRVEVVLDLHVGPGADLTRTADQACGRAHQMVEERMGIELAQRPRARLHYRELRLADANDGASQRPATGWERPATDEGMHD